MLSLQQTVEATNIKCPTYLKGSALQLPIKIQLFQSAVRNLSTV